MLGQLLKPSYNKPYFSLKAKKPLVWKHLKPQGLVLSIQYHKLLSSCCVCCLLRISSSWGGLFLHCDDDDAMLSYIEEISPPASWPWPTYQTRKYKLSTWVCEDLRKEAFWCMRQMPLCPGSGSGYVPTPCHPAPADSADICHHTVRYMCGILNTEHLRACHS